MLGPLLFLAYINNLPSRVKAKARLFADDCLLYRNIKTNEDAESLQDDLNKLQDWETDWQMHFNPDKCELIRITNKRKTINAMYQIHGAQLKQTKKAKYLGLTFTSTLSWNAHIDTITKKANNTTAFLRRNLPMCPRKVKDTCYKTFVKPQVEYAATVWDPHTTESIKKVEAVQRRAARFVTGDYRTTSSVTAMVDSLSWETLQHRRQQTKAIMMFRIVHAMVAIPASPNLQLLGAATRGHQYRYRVPYCRTNIYKNSFFPSTIRLWNQLPEEQTAAESLDVFKAGISAAIKP